MTNKKKSPGAGQLINQLIEDLERGMHCYAYETGGDDKKKIFKHTGDAQVKLVELQGRVFRVSFEEIPQWKVNVMGVVED